ncbi:hypothetical protein BSKO_12815 [Bryopsis sp. KO-2023]|nr:hypothetical protein BSKO_12815 [Bryopsis sp. KO-2023]
MPLRFLQVFSLVVCVVCTFAAQHSFEKNTTSSCNTTECQKDCDPSKGSLLSCNATESHQKKEPSIKNTIFSKGNSTISENDEMSVASFEAFVILLLAASLLVVWWRKRRMV